MKKIATAILVFDLMAGLLFLGLWESNGEMIAWKEATGKTVTGTQADRLAVPEQTLDNQEEIRKIAITFDDDVIIGLSQEISYKEAVSMI